MLPTASVNLLAATSMVVAPAARRKGSSVNGGTRGRKITNRTASDGDIACGKVVVASLEVKVTVRVLSLVVAPSATALEPLVAVMVMVGATLS